MHAKTMRICWGPKTSENQQGPGTSQRKVLKIKEEINATKIGMVVYYRQTCQIVISQHFSSMLAMKFACNGLSLFPILNDIVDHWSPLVGTTTMGLNKGSGNQGGFRI